jgi:formylglycine-generating enzyme required for sulfatase activity
MKWHEFGAGVRPIGHSAAAGFSFDNEGPAHRVFLEPFSIASRLVTNGEFLEFIQDGGYRRPEFWLSNGWATVRDGGWTAPFIGNGSENEWREFTLAAMAARSFPARLPRELLRGRRIRALVWSSASHEAEWETAATSQPIAGTFADSARFHPAASGGSGQWYGDVWQWTQSAYVAYPGFQPSPGAIGEYNGKWMCDQWVLRGRRARRRNRTHA